VKESAPAFKVRVRRAQRWNTTGLDGTGIALL